LVGAEYIGFRIGTRGWPLVNTVMNLGISWEMWNFLSTWETISFSWRSETWMGGWYWNGWRQLIRKQDMQHNTQQERTQPTISNTHAHWGNLYINNICNETEESHFPSNMFNTWWWPYWSKHVVINFSTEYLIIHFIEQMFWKCGTVQIFENDYNKSKSDSGGN
jgi:hypothetical protein